MLRPGAAACRVPAVAAYTGQVVAAALSAHGEARGDALNMLPGLAWLVATAVDHLGEVLFVPTGNYRAGLVSKVLGGARFGWSGA